MSLADRLAAHDPATEDLGAPRVPQGWAPGVVWEGTSGTITTRPVDTPAEATDWSALLAERGLDPDRYEVVGDSVRWCSFDGWRRDQPGDDAYSATLYSYKAEIRLRRPAADAAPDLEQIAADIRRTRPRKRPAAAGDATWVCALGDWQIGNADAGGVRAQLDAIAALPDLLTARLREIRRRRPVGHVVVAGLGDLTEGTCGHYPAQQWSVQANRREQVRIVRRGVYEIVKALAPLAERVTLTAVGGNHGENRQGGRAFTDPADNDDVAAFEMVAERLAERPDLYGHVAARLPADRLAVSIDCSGTLVAFTHGHLARPKGLPAATLWSWWESQAMGRYYPGVADAQILVTGHYHHLNVRAQAGRTLMIGPSLTAVGAWWGDATGQTCQPGTLTFGVDGDGWFGLEVIR